MNFLGFGKKKKQDTRASDSSESDFNLISPDRNSSPNGKKNSVINHKRSNSTSSSLSEIFPNTRTSDAEKPELTENIDPKFKKRKIFGGALTDSDEAIPPIIEKLMLYIELKYLDEVHILFANGESLAMKELQELVEKQVPFTTIVDMELEQKPFTICGVLKKFVRDLPDTLLTIDLYQKFVDCGRLQSPEERLETLTQLIPQLPERNREVLARWMRFFERILVYKDKNKLNAQKLSTTLGINLSRQDDIRGFQDIPPLNKIVEDMINNSTSLFPAEKYKEMSEDIVKNDLVRLELQKEDDSIPNLSDEGKDFRIIMKAEMEEVTEKLETKTLIPVYVLDDYKGEDIEYRMKIFYKADGQTWSKQLKLNLSMKLSEFEQKVLGWLKTYLPKSELTLKDIIIKARGYNEYIFGYDKPLIDFEFIRYCIDEEAILELSVEEVKILQVNSTDDLKPFSGSKVKDYKYEVVSYKSEDIVDFSKGHKVISAWEFTKQPMKVLIKNLVLPEIHDFGIDFYFYVGVRLYYGNTLICPQELTPLINHSAKKGEWNCSLVFEESFISQLPLESHMLFFINGFSKDTLEKLQKLEDSNSRNDDKNKFVEQNIGYTRVPIFNHKKEMISGIRTFRLWSGSPNPNGIISYIQNSDPNAVQLNVEFDMFDHPIVYPDGKRDLTNSRLPSKYLNHILNQDCLVEMSEKDKLLVWNYRDYCKNIPNALPKVLKTVNWTDYAQVYEMYKYLDEWKKFEDPQLALELLDNEFQDSKVREYATKLLDEISDIDLANMMLQLVEICKYEAFHYSPFIKFLLKRAIKCPHLVGVKMYWSLKSQLDNLQIKERFQLIIEEYLRSCDKSHKAELEKQSYVIDELLKIATIISNQPKSAKPQDLNNLLRKLLQELKLPKEFSTPLDIKVQCCGIIIDECKVMKSKKRPLKLTLKNADSQGEDFVIFFKAGDDLRQDELTLQLLRIMDSLWKKEGLDFHINAYGCVSTSKDVGLIHCVSNSITIASLSSGITETTAKETILNWIKKTGKTEEFLVKAVDNFKLSCAGYLVATHVLGIGDRHNDNIMMTGNGDLFHIDFGHFLGHRKKFAGVERENTPFVFTKAYAHVLGGPGSTKYNELQELTGKAFNILRKNSNLLIILFKLMMHCGLPELTKNKDIEWIREKLVLEMTPDDAAQHFCGLFIESMKNTRQMVMDAVHYWKHHT